MCIRDSHSTDLTDLHRGAPIVLALPGRGAIIIGSLRAVRLLPASVCVLVDTTSICTVPVGFTSIGRIQAGPSRGVLGRAAFVLPLVAPFPVHRASSLTVFTHCHVLMAHPLPRLQATTASARANRVQVTVWVSSLIEP